MKAKLKKNWMLKDDKRNRRERERERENKKMEKGQKGNKWMKKKTSNMLFFVIRAATNQRREAMQHFATKLQRSMLPSHLLNPLNQKIQVDELMT